VTRVFCLVAAPVLIAALGACLHYAAKFIEKSEQ